MAHALPRRPDRARQIILFGAVWAGLVASVNGQSVCNDSDVVFVGRAEASVTFHVSGEAEIEKARRNAALAEEEFERLTASGPEWQRDPRTMEITLRLVKAKQELGMRKAMYPPPYEVTFIPLAVVRPFRGVSEATIMLHARPDLRPMLPGEEYLVYGARSRNLIPPLPEMGDLASLPDYVEGSVMPAASAQQHLQFLGSTTGGATVVGSLAMQPFGMGIATPLRGVRIVVSSGTQVVETTTHEDGGFVASGINPGELDITAVLAPDLTLVERPRRKPFVRNGGCATVNLRAAVNGRVRGRIVGSTDVSLDTVRLQLRVAYEDRHMFGSEDPSFGTTARADGTFEFSGVVPGSYLLSASVAKSDGTSRSVTYYPGTDDLNAAIPVVVGKATEHNGMDFVITTE